jgi:hypothetical protein
LIPAEEDAQIRPTGWRLAPEILAKKSATHRELDELMLNVKEIDRLYYDHIERCPDCRGILDLAIRLWNGRKHPYY